MGSRPPAEFCWVASGRAELLSVVVISGCQRLLLLLLPALLAEIANITGPEWCWCDFIWVGCFDLLPHVHRVSVCWGCCWLSTSQLPRSLADTTGKA
jgi:hypothetical protein